MAGAIVFTEVLLGTMKKITGEWTSDAAGDAQGTTTSYYSGEIAAFSTIPNPDADTGFWPTDNYDIVGRDNEGFDVIAAGGVDRDVSGEEAVSDTVLGAICHSQITFTVTNAGAVNYGKFAAWIR